MDAVSDIAISLEEIHDAEVADYFREAVVCYRHGAYRASVGMIHNTVFSHLREQLRHLAEVNTPARTVHRKLESLQPHEAYEATLETEMKAANLLEPEQSRFLYDLRNRRNDAAHPNGHVVTKEHVRYLLSDAVSFFLSKRSLFPRQAVSDLQERLQGDAFLPTHGAPEHLRKIIVKQIELFNPRTYGALFAMLTTCLSSPEHLVRQNARTFVETLSALRRDDIRMHLARGLYSRRLHKIGRFEDDYSKTLFWSFVWDPAIAEHLDEGDLLQFDQSLTSYCLESLQSDPDWPAPEFLFQNLLAVAPHLLGEKLPRTTGFLAANYPATKHALEMLKQSSVTRDYVLHAFEEVVKGPDAARTRRLFALVEANEMRIVEENDAETLLRLLRSLKLQSYSDRQWKQAGFTALKARVQQHYGVPAEDVPQEVARRSSSPQGSLELMRHDTFMKPRTETPPVTGETGWDWSR